MSHNHHTRDIKPKGKCPACDIYHERRKPEMTEQKDPVAKTVKIVEDETRMNGERTIIVDCPYCHIEHRHGYPKKGEPLTNAHRGSHCSGGGYFLEKEEA